MKGPVYTPAGRAREYSPHALNVYCGCTHGCDYCYCPRILHRSHAEWSALPSPRAGVADALRRQLARSSFREQVLLSFVGDCFCATADDSAAAVECVSILRAASVPTAILTKGGRRLLRACDEIKAYPRGMVAVGATLTFDDPAESARREPGAASPAERLDILAGFHSDGVLAFASFEPVLDPAQTLRLIRHCAERGILDDYKVGKLNGDPAAESAIDWASFLREAVAVLRSNGCRFLVKRDLAAFGDGLGLAPAELDPDLHVLRAP